MAALSRRAVIFFGSRHVAPAASVASSLAPRPPALQPLPPRRAMSNLAAFKRGTGGRSSFSGLVCTVFGANGFIGKRVTNRLGKIGSQIIVPYRSDPYMVKDLKLCGDLGQVLFVPFDLKDEESLREVMKYSNVVINLIGREWETKNFTFNDVNFIGARNIARIAKEMGVQKFLHVSHLNGSPNPPDKFIKGGSRYLKSKYEGELAVRAQFPEAVIFRPGDVYGAEDRYVYYYMSWARRHFNNLPVYNKGRDTIKSPVYVSDLAEGIVNAIRDPSSDGQIYECIGPKTYYLYDLIDYYIKVSHRSEWTSIANISPTFRWKVKLLEKILLSYPRIYTEKLEMENMSDQITGRHPTLEDLGVKLTFLEDRMTWEMKPFVYDAYYGYKPLEYPDPDPPPTIQEREKEKGVFL